MYKLILGGWIYMGVDLLKHNQEAYEKITQAIADGKKRIAISHATGTGKSYLIAKLFEDYSNDKKLVLVPSTYISDQIQKLFEKYSIQNVDVILYQKLIKMNDMDIAAMDYDVVALDEYHHDAATKVWGGKVKTLIETHSETIFFGTSATPIKTDGVNAIDELFEGNCVSDLSLSESIAKKIVPLPKYVGALYTLDDELERLRKKVKNATNTREEKQEFYKKINAMRSQIEKSYGMPIILNKNIENKEGKYIVFCKNKKHLAEIKDTVIGWFRTAGCKNINAYVVHSSYENKDAEYKAFCEDTSHSLKLLFSIDVLNEGSHLENISGVLLLRPTRSSIVWHQQIGRAIEANNINMPVIIDAVNNFRFAGQGMKLFKEIRDAVEREKKSNPNFEDSRFEDIDTFFVLEQIVEIQEMFKKIEAELTGKEWTAEEDNILKEYYSVEGSEVINRLSGRTKRAIMARANLLGINKIEKGSTWTKEEIEILKKYYPFEGAKVINRLNGRTIAAIKTQTRDLGIKSPKTWTEEEINILKKYYPLYGRNTVKYIPRRSCDAIQRKADNLGIKHNRRIFEEWEDELIRKYYPVEGYAVYKRLNGKTKNQCAARAGNLGVLAISRSWTDEEIEILKKYYPKEGTKVKSRLNNRTKQAVMYQVVKLGLKFERNNKYRYVIKQGDKYIVQIYFNGKNIRFGTFDSEEEAARVAKEKAREYGKAI